MDKDDKAAIQRGDAREALSRIGATPGQNFFALRSEQIEQVLHEADRVKYRAPRNANGSRARYFFARLQRHAAREL